MISITVRSRSGEHPEGHFITNSKKQLEQRFPNLLSFIQPLESETGFITINTEQSTCVISWTNLSCLNE